MENTNNRVGEKHFSNSNEYFTIIEYFDNKNVTIQFNDGTIVYNKTYANIKIGKISNPNNTHYGIGFIGEGNYSTKQHKSIYNLWQQMLRRCYCENFHLIQSNYKNCTVDERWHNFQVFAKWCENNYVDEFVLDKDILIKGNKIYSPETCCFVPQEINSLFTKCDKSRGDLPIGITKINNKYLARLSKFGKRVNLGKFLTIEQAFNIYKINKEFYIQQMANKWKPKIPDILYQAMFKYKVEITD